MTSNYTPSAPRRLGALNAPPNGPDSAASGPILRLKHSLSEQRVEVFGIGVQKAATTWLYRNLIQHPEIHAAVRRSDRSRKELNFFNRYYERGYEWYHGLFEFGPWLNVDFSILYFANPGVPGRLHRYNPDARLILLLRNPIDRAYSQHRHEIRRGRVPKELYAFREAERLNPSYLDQGRYASHLDNWLRYFSLKRFLIVDYDAVRSEPSALLRAALEFVGVDPHFEADGVAEVVNARTPRRRLPALNPLVNSASAWIRRSLGEKTHRAISVTGIPAVFRRLNRRLVDDQGIPPLSRADRAWMREQLAPEIHRLGEILGKDFSHWS